MMSKNKTAVSQKLLVLEFHLCAQMKGADDFYICDDSYKNVNRHISEKIGMGGIILRRSYLCYILLLYNFKLLLIITIVIF